MVSIDGGFPCGGNVSYSGVVVCYQRAGDRTEGYQPASHQAPLSGNYAGKRSAVNRRDACSLELRLC